MNSGLFASEIFERGNRFGIMFIMRHVGGNGWDG